MAYHRGSLYYAGIGDAYALPFEYRDGAYKSWGHLNDGRHYEVHPTFAATTKPGNFSDDTHRATALAVVMLAKKHRLAGAFDLALLLAFEHNPDAGYSRGMRKAFERASATALSVGQVCSAFGKSEKSGAAMGAAVLGLLPHLDEVRDAARLQGSITHQGSALLAAEIAAVAMHGLYYRLCSRKTLVSWLGANVSEPFDLTPWQGKVGSPGMESTWAAITALVWANSLTELLRSCVAFTGDVDTVAAIAMALAAYSDLPDDLDLALHEGLERGQWGREYLIRLDTKLQAHYPRPAV